MHALRLEFGSAAQLSKRQVSVWNCLRGNALERSHGIIRKSRVLYPGPGFLSSATWPSPTKKHLVGVHPRNIHTKFEANPCSGLREEVEKLKKFTPTTTTTTDTA